MISHLMTVAPLMTLTPSLKGFFWGLLFGAVVLGAAFGGLLLLSQVDKIQRS